MKTISIRNKVYSNIEELNIENFKAIGNVKEGFLFRDENGTNMIIKVIIKKNEVNYEKEQVKRLLENEEVTD